MNTQTALQVTDFNFYGDELIALRDNVAGEIFTADKLDFKKYQQKCKTLCGVKNSVKF